MSDLYIIRLPFHQMDPLAGSLHYGGFIGELQRILHFVGIQQDLAAKSLWRLD